jgi:hypothetical protein
MKKHIAEDLPARKHPQAQMSAQSKAPERSERKSGGDDDKGEKTPEQRIRQAVYDIRYRARRENVPLRTAYSQYMQNSSMGESEKSVVRQKLFGKEGGGMQAEDFTNYMKDSASNAVSKALFKVFLEKKEEIVDVDQLKYELGEKVNETSESKKYKVRVRDRQSGVTYVRYATREKISQLRAKGLEVEMTEYGTPYEGERERGEQTSAALGGGKAKRDYDGDGKVESGAKEYRGSVHNAIQRKKGGVPDGKDTSSVKEGFLGEVSATANLPQTDAPQNVNPDTNSTQIDFTTKKNKIVVNPTDNSQSKLMSHHEMKGEVIVENGYSKFLKKVHSLQEKAESEQQQKLFGLALSVKRGKTSRSEVSDEVLKIVDSMSEKEIRKFAKTKHEGIPKQKVQKEEAECGSKEEDKVDRRPLATAINLAKNKVRAMGIKNPIMMVTASENVKESSYEINPSAHRKLQRIEKATELRNKTTGSESGAASDAIRRMGGSGVSLPVQKAHYEPEGDLVDEATRLFYKLQAKGKRGSSTARAQETSDADLERQKGVKVAKQKAKQRQEREPEEDHPSLSARERNPNLR